MGIDFKKKLIKNGEIKGELKIKKKKNIKQKRKRIST